MKSRKMFFKKLWKSNKYTYKEMAKILDQEGYYTEFGKKFTPNNIQYYGMNIYKLGPKGRPPKNA